MSDAGGFFQFPLCLLARKTSHEDVLRVALSYSIMHFIEQETGETYNDLMQSPGSKEAFLAYERAERAMRFQGGDIYATQGRRRIAEEWINARVARFGPDALVRVKSAILFDSLHGRGLPPMDFRVLAAIYSAIGKKLMAHVSLSSIRMRAAGCKSADVFADTSARGEVYTDKQLRRAVDRLNADGEGYFARATFRNAETYYSHRLSRTQLWAEIVEAKLEGKRKQAAMREQDALMSARIASARATSGQPEGNLTGNLLGSVGGDTNRNSE